jgi:hypothetical protein
VQGFVLRAVSERIAIERKGDIDVRKGRFVLGVALYITSPAGVLAGSMCGFVSGGYSG